MSQEQTDRRLSKRVAHIGLSMTVSVAQKARQLQEQGIRVINMGAGELDFETPDFIKYGAIQGIIRGETRYTYIGGMPALKETIKEKFQNDNSLTYTTQQIITGTGAKHLLFNAFQATLDKGDEVIIPAPYWVSYPDMVRLAEGTPVFIKTSAQNEYKMTADQLRHALTPNTKWVLLNSPGNPTGAIYSREELRALGEILCDYPNVLILSDDIYETLTYDVPSVTFADAVPELKDHTLTLNGVSKGYAMTGWRLGYAGGPEWLIKAMEKLQAQSTSNPSSISQVAALTALTGNTAFLSGWRKILAERREYAFSILKTSPLLTVHYPQGAFYMFVDCQRALGKCLTDQHVTVNDDIELASFLIEHARVAVVPGSAFGYPGHFRLAFSIASEDVITACQAIVTALEKLK